MVPKKECVIMQEVINATDVRRDWGSFIDHVVRFKPSLIKRNRDYLAAISLEHLEVVLSPYRFTLEHEKEVDGSLSGSLKELDIMTNAASLEALKTEIAKELIEYAQEYMDEFAKYYGAPNRKPHFPYVMRVLIQKDEDAVRGLLDA
ncbi:hypothetical protein [Desulfosporosinus sp. OT]|uniref:hypothetical protein n=1 Tax=Desulfosporosinus sp. OT TaxID=913865 RepID=UPI0002239CA8|nr:hypothetical protein [Desulfosporosinus sp. OT]EGW40135.1 hypothetical protein DOT_1963 [Desulfosporosinus sp. OT]